MIVIEKVGNKKFKKTYLKLEDNNSNLKGKEIAYSFYIRLRKHSKAYTKSLIKTHTSRY